MVRMLLRFLVLTAIAAAATWLAYRPGSLTLEWLGHHIELPLAVAVIVVFAGVAIMVLAWSGLRRLLQTPGAVGDYFRFRRTRRGQEALASGMIAVSAGDLATARRQAQIATRILPEEPLAKLLEAQAAGLEGNSGRVKAIYSDMLANPDTELVALRGLFEAARRSGDAVAAQRYAERALKRNPGLGWASAAMLAIRSAQGDWPAVSATIEAQRRARLLDDDSARYQRAVVLTAQALAAEESEPDAALDLATRAHKLDPALVPAAVVAGRLNAHDGSLRRAVKILERTWALSPHPDIAAVYAHARSGDSPLDRLKRVRDLLKVAHGGEEGAVALAEAAIDARDWKLAREALADFIDDRPRARVCALMAEIEEGEFGDKGRAREWLARAVRAPRDPMWIAGGTSSRSWLPVSPVNGELGAFRWAPPPEALGALGSEDVGAAEITSSQAPGAGEHSGGETIAALAPPPATTNESPTTDGTEVTLDEAPPALQPAEAPPPPPKARKAKAGPVKTAESASVVLERQPDDPGLDPDTGEPRKTGWLRTGDAV